MIRGVGIDLVSVDRFERLLNRWGQRLRQRLFTDAELMHCKGRMREAQCLAACFSAKEALLKAMGTGLAQGITWKDVQVIRHKGAPPAMTLRGRALERFNEMGLRGVSLSISHEQGLCVATVVVE